MSWDEYDELMAGRNDMTGMPAVSPDECPNRCSAMGICERHTAAARQPSTPACFCHYGRTGPDCSEDARSPCVNDCSNRGTCLRGRATTTTTRATAHARAARASYAAPFWVVARARARSFCSCQPGFFGIDCSIDLERARLAAARARARTRGCVHRRLCGG